MSEENKTVDTGEATQAPLPDVSINQGAIAVVCRIIAAATERGAIKPEELTVVGNVYDYLKQFVAEAPSEAPSEDEAVADDTSETASVSDKD